MTFSTGSRDRLDLRAGRRVPDVHRAVGSAGRDDFAIGGDIEGRERGGHRRKRPHEAAVGTLVEAHDAVGPEEADRIAECIRQLRRLRDSGPGDALEALEGGWEIADSVVDHGPLIAEVITG